MTYVDNASVNKPRYNYNTVGCRSAIRATMKTKPHAVCCILPFPTPPLLSQQQCPSPRWARRGDISLPLRFLSFALVLIIGIIVVAFVSTSIVIIFLVILRLFLCFFFPRFLEVLAVVIIGFLCVRVAFFGFRARGVTFAMVLGHGLLWVVVSAALFVRAGWRGVAAATYCLAERPRRQGGKVRWGFCVEGW